MKIRILTLMVTAALLLDGFSSRGDSLNSATPDSATGIPISTLPLTIDRSGSYYVTGNLTGAGGITVSASDVTIDLKGFALTGIHATNSGIFAPFETTNLVVRNGSIQGWNGHGIYAQPVRNCQISNLEISSNRFNGLDLGQDSRVTDCRVHDNAMVGILSGDNTIIKNCVVTNNLGDGIRVDATAQVIGTLSLKNSDNGILVGRDCQVRDCTSAWNRRSGIYVNQAGCSLVDNNCYSNNPTAFLTAAGIYVFDSNNRVENNHVSENGNGGIIIGANYTNNVILKNIVSGSGSNNYVIPPGNDVGAIVAAESSPNAKMNISN